MSQHLMIGLQIGPALARDAANQHNKRFPKGPFTRWRGPCARDQVVACVAKTAAGADADPALRRGLKWLREAVESDFAKLGPRVQAEAARQAEEEARKVAERKARVEAQRAERKRLQEVCVCEREALTHAFPQVFVRVAGSHGSAS